MVRDCLALWVDGSGAAIASEMSTIVGRGGVPANFC
jgi:hypothetical protein